MTDKIAAAFCAMIFAAILLLALLAFGSHAVRTWAMVAAALGVVTQYAGQGTTKAHLAATNIAVVFGFLALIVAIVTFALGN